MQYREPIPIYCWNMATLKLPDNPTPEQIEKLKKPMVKRIIEDFYTDGVSDLTVELPGKDGAIASGKFLDVVMMGGKQNNRVFEYKITKSGSEYKLDYKPISGDFGEGADGDSSADYAESSTEFELITDADIASYQERCNQVLVAELQAVGLGSFVEPDEPAWAKV